MVRVAIVGAGIVGAAAAERLTRAGARVTVVESHRVGAATAAGAGIIAPVSSRPLDDAAASFRVRAARHYLELAALTDAGGHSNHSYGAVGQLTVALDEDEAQALVADHERSLDLVAQFGPVAIGMPEVLDPLEVARRFPLVATTWGALWLPEVARVDGARMRDTLLSLALARGAEWVTGGARLEVEGDRIVGVRIGDAHADGPRLIEADAVVVAAGAWSSELTATAVSVAPQRGQILHLRLPGASALPTLDSYAGHYLLTFPGDRVVVGATRETGSGFAPDLTAGGLETVLAQGFSLVPSLREATWIEARVGLRPLSADGYPVLGADPVVDGLWLATGMGPTGLTLGPYCGAVIAEHLLGLDAPAIPESYRPGR